MKTFLRVCLLSAVGTAAVFGIVAAILRICEQEIIDMVLRYFAQHQQVLFHKESIELNLRAAFPYCSVEAGGVRISRQSADPRQMSFEAEARHMYVSINPIEFLRRRRIDIRRLWLFGGEARVTLPAGADAPPAASWLPVDIGSVEMEQFRVRVDGHIVDIQHIEVGMRQEGAALEVVAQGEFTLSGGSIANINPIFKTPAQARLQMQIEGRQMRFEESRITLAGINVGFEGHISPREVALQAECQSGRLERAAPFFISPNSKIKGLQGKFKAKAKVEGADGTAGRLKVSGTAQAAKARAVIDGQRADIAGARAQFASGDIRDMRQWTCSIADADIRYGGWRAQAAASVSNFAEPYIQAQAAVAGGLRGMGGIFEEGEAHGSISADFYGRDFEIKNLNASIQIHDALALIGQTPCRLDGAADITDQSIALPALRIQSPFASGVFRGRAHNYMALRNGAEGGAVRITGAFRAQSINADSIIGIAAAGKEDRDDRENKDSGRGGFPAIKAKIDIQAQEMTLFNYTYAPASFALQYSNGRAAISDFAGGAFGGRASGRAAIEVRNGGGSAQGRVDFADIQIDSIPYFDKYFRRGSLLGSVTGSISLNAPFGRQGADLGKMRGRVDFSIENGQMIDFKPADALADYVQKEHLKRIRFLTLKNTLAIEDGAVHIPQMEVRSSALNAYIAGVHCFNSDFDYRITLFFTELLRGKAQQLTNPIKEGKTKVFLHAIKKDGRFSIDYDTDIGKNIKAAIKKERESFAKAKDAPAAAPLAIEHEEVPSAARKPPAKQTEVKKEKPAVAIEWDDE